MPERTFMLVGEMAADTHVVIWAGPSLKIVRGARTAKWMRSVARQLKQQTQNFQPLDCPCELHVAFRLAKPSSWPQAPTKRCPFPDRPFRRPDIDNCLKPLIDAATGILWRDDALIVKIVAEKSWKPTGPDVVELKLVWEGVDIDANAETAATAE